MRSLEPEVQATRCERSRYAPLGDTVAIVKSFGGHNDQNEMVEEGVFLSTRARSALADASAQLATTWPAGGLDFLPAHSDTNVASSVITVDFVGASVELITEHYYSISAGTWVVTPGL